MSYTYDAQRITDATRAMCRELYGDGFDLHDAGAQDPDFRAGLERAAEAAIDAALPDTNVVWVAELDLNGPSLSASWMSVNATRHGAREALCRRVTELGFGDMWEQAVNRDIATASPVASSTCVSGEDRELSYVINRYPVGP